MENVKRLGRITDAYWKEKPLDRNRVCFKVIAELKEIIQELAPFKDNQDTRYILGDTYVVLGQVEQSMGRYKDAYKHLSIGIGILVSCNEEEICAPSLGKAYTLRHGVGVILAGNDKDLLKVANLDLAIAKILSPRLSSIQRSA